MLHGREVWKVTSFSCGLLSFCGLLLCSRHRGCLCCLFALLVSSCCFVICRRSLIISPGRQLSCSGTQLLPGSSVLLLQTAHCGSPRMCAVCYFFCLTCSANPARLVDTHTSSLFAVYDGMRSQVKSKAV